LTEEQQNNLQVTQEELQNADDIVQSVERLEPQVREVVLSRLEIYQGDLPHPKILEGYNELYEDAAKLIITNGIEESKHRRSMEQKFMESQFKERKLGQILGFILALVMTCVGGYLILSGQTVVGSLLSGVTALGMVGLFTGNNNKQNNKE
jgi:uncharacterized membrane protein